MEWNLWLDDQYDDPDVIAKHPPPNFYPARSSCEAVELTRNMGIPAFISFDFDLGGEDNAMVYINWLIDQFFDGPIPNYQIHSANPIGALNIQSKMESWKRSKEL